MPSAPSITLINSWLATEHGPCSAACAAQTHYEVVVVHEDEQRARDAVYNTAAGVRVPRAVHRSGTNFTTGRNGTIVAGHYSNRR